jgi:hypothetical protein
MLSQIHYHWLYYEKMPNKSLQPTATALSVLTET